MTRWSPYHGIAYLAAAFFLSGLLGRHAVLSAETPPADSDPKLEALVQRYDGMLEGLRAELLAALPALDPQQRERLTEAGKAVIDPSEDLWRAGRIKDPEARATKGREIQAAHARAREHFFALQVEFGVRSFLRSDALDGKLATYVVLRDATPAALAAFARQTPGNDALVEHLLADPDLMKQMVVADGAMAPYHHKTGYGPAQVGPAMKIYREIQEASPKAAGGVLQRLALAIALRHAISVKQRNPAAASDAPATVDPVQRYLHFEKAYLEDELDPGFAGLSVWDLRMVVDGDEPDATLAWGRKVLRNFRPDHIYQPNQSWRYVGIVRSDVQYGSGDSKYDRPELQFYHNILMNGGICGRRAFFGRFMLRAWGIPTIRRPSRGHGALARWTPSGWVVCLGPQWGRGKNGAYGRYPRDLDFLATTQARQDAETFLQVKRAQWAGDVAGERRTYGECEKEADFWHSLSAKTQRALIEEAKRVALQPVGEDRGEADGEERRTATPSNTRREAITTSAEGAITIPAAAFDQPAGGSKEVLVMKSFAGGRQIYLPRFSLKGKTILRGGTWKGEPDACASGKRLLSDGRGVYENWGLRAAMTAKDGEASPELTLALADGVNMEFVYIEPGSFLMGGENTKEGRFLCVETPKHEVRITQGFYLGKYEVTQAQFEAIIGSNPSRSTKAPNCPVDQVSWRDALLFCERLAATTGRETRLPTEAEWEYACRAGSTTRWFFGEDPAPLGDYAWYKDNAEGGSHPVGEKKPNPWGLYDIYGNVCERVADVYAADYYAKSPKEDPAGPSQDKASRFDYAFGAPRAGTYRLTARVVTANHAQRLMVSANGTEAATMKMPFTNGAWMESKPVEVVLEAGENRLRFWREKPPQKGLAIKSFTLTPLASPSE